MATAPKTLEVQQIEKTIYCYIEGLRSTTSQYLMQAFETQNGHFQCLVHNTATRRDEITNVSLMEAAREWPRHPDQQASGEIISIDSVDNKMAVAKVHLFYDGSDFIDYLSLYKLNNEWKIVNKISLNRGYS